MDEEAHVDYAARCEGPRQFQTVSRRHAGAVPDFQCELHIHGVASAVPSRVAGVENHLINPSPSPSPMKTHPTAKLLRRPFLKRRAPLVCSVGILAFAVMGQAAEVTWDGSDAVNNAGWINGLNWVGDLAPNPGDALFFDGTAGLANSTILARARRSTGSLSNRARGRSCWAGTRS